MMFVTVSNRINHSKCARHPRLFWPVQKEEAATLASAAFQLAMKNASDNRASAMRRRLSESIRHLDNRLLSANLFHASNKSATLAPFPSDSSFPSETDPEEAEED